MVALLAYLRAAFAWLAPVCLVLAGAWWLLSALTADTITIIRWANYATAWIGIGLLIVGTGLMAGRARAWGLSYLVAALIVLAPYHAQLGRSLVPGGAGDMPPGALRVLSYNTMLRNPDVDAISKVVLAHRPDIALLQEVLMPDELEMRLRELYDGAPVYVARDDYLRLMIVARFPLQPGKSRNGVQRAMVDMQGQKVGLRNLHAVRGVDEDAGQLAFVDHLIADLATVYSPVILAGDFNMTEGNEGYRRLRQWLRNVHEEAGRGFGFTFATPQRRFGTLAPLIRIDHIFTSRHFEVLNARALGQFGNSDHFPIDAVLLLRR
ncbi:MAG: endonuclease/exonuclease/phosphatase family protein [Parvibaculaceae bacterium]